MSKIDAGGLLLVVMIIVTSAVIWYGNRTPSVIATKVDKEREVLVVDVVARAWKFRHCTPTNKECGRLE